MKKCVKKLVRDFIPDIILSSGGRCTFYILSDMDYQQALKEKLLEETKEFYQSGNLEEIADILEVINCYLSTIESSVEEVEKIRYKKVKLRGSFSKKFFLVDYESI